MSLFVFVLLLLAAAFIGGAYVCFRFFEPEIMAPEPAQVAAVTQAKLDALEASYRITAAAWEAERALYNEALRLDQQNGQS